MPDSDRDAPLPGSPVRLRADGRLCTGDPATRLVPVVSRRPRLSWVNVAGDGENPTAWQVRVCPDPHDPRTSPDAYYDGAGDSSDPFAEVEVDLEPHARYRWSVRVRTDADGWGPWAPPVPLETGPLSFDDWHAAWVSQPATATLRTVFSLAETPTCARIHIAAQGLVRAAVNETAVNATATDTTRTDYVRALYRTYDVTDLCRTGENAIDITTAQGEWERTGFDPRVLVELVAELPNGERFRVGTGTEASTWRSEVITHEPFYLERHDARIAPDFGPAAKPTTVDAVDAPTSPAQPPRDVQPDGTPALHDVLEIDPVEVDRVDGARIFDVGVNVAGRTTLELDSGVPAGAVITVVHGEHLDARGRLDTTNLTMPFDRGRVRQAVEYVSTGRSGQRCTPWFAYHGFRYVEVQGLPLDATVRLVVHTHHSDLEQISELHTDDEQVNRLIQRAKRTLLNNVHGIPEDCPTREQSGWTGDSASVTEFEYSAFDMEAFFRKWLADMRTSQQPDGALPAIAPDVRAEKIPADPVWGAALQRVLINHWYHYGDRRVVDENLPALRRWADFQLAARDDAGVVSRAPISYGSDWLALQQTPPPVHHTAATIDCLLVLAELEDAVGDPELTPARRLQAEELRAAARRAFFDEVTGTFGNGSQGSYGCAIEAGILTGEDAERAAARIEDDVRARGNRVSSGFATTRSVVRSLARSGRSQVLFDVLQQRAEPGVGAMADHGPGTLWECWWIDPYNTGTGSLDHVGLGGPFASWAWQHLAGVRPIAPGYARFHVEPQFVSGVDSLSLTTETIRGVVRVDYRRDGEVLRVSVRVPRGAEALLTLPGSEPQTAGPGEHTYELPWPATTQSVPAMASAPWRPPSPAPVSADVRGDFDLLAAAIPEDRVRAAGAQVDVYADGIVCMPVPHAQESGPVLRVVADDADAAAVPLAQIAFHEPLDLTQATFAYAMVDLCLETTARPVDTVIVLHGADGSSIEATGRFWPAGWNRASVDITDWSGRSAVIAIEAGIRYATTDVLSAPDGAPANAPAFHLGEVGYSTLKRTW